MLVGGRCTIYDDRPLACRTYDCRIYAAADLVRTEPAIREQVERWRFSHPTREDLDRHAAVRTAARFIGERRECLPSEAARREPLRVATLAIAVHESFLEKAPHEISPGSIRRERARAVAAANEKLFGDG